MKLYKNGKCMQSVDRDQLQDCLDAGWSRTDEVVEAEAVEKVEVAKAIELDDGEEEETFPAPESAPKSAPPAIKRKTRIKPLKNK